MGDAVKSDDVGRGGALADRSAVTIRVSTNVRRRS